MITSPPSSAAVAAWIITATASSLLLSINSCDVASNRAILQSLDQKYPTMAPVDSTNSPPSSLSKSPPKRDGSTGMLLRICCCRLFLSIDDEDDADDDADDDVFLNCFNETTAACALPGVVVATTGAFVCVANVVVDDDDDDSHVGEDDTSLQVLLGVVGDVENRDRTGGEDGHAGVVVVESRMVVDGASDSNSWVCAKECNLLCQKCNPFMREMISTATALRHCRLEKARAFFRLRPTACAL